MQLQQQDAEGEEKDEEDRASPIRRSLEVHGQPIRSSLGRGRGGPRVAQLTNELLIGCQ